MDSDAFEKMVGEHYQPLFRFALSLSRSESDARDLTQQTFYILATKGDQMRDISKAKSWLFTTLHRAFLQLHRRRAILPINSLEDVAPDDLPTITPEISNTLDSSRALTALAKVDAIYQAALALFYLQECSYRQIAEILDVPIGTVKSRLARGISQLRTIMKVPEIARSSERYADEIKHDKEASEQAPLQFGPPDPLGELRS